MSIFSTRNPIQAPDPKEGLKIFERTLKSNNIRYEVHKSDGDEEQHWKRYTFDFQGGHFFALFYLKVGCVEVMFPRVIDIDPDQLTVVRTLCNYHTTISTAYKYTYKLDREENLVIVNISFYLNFIDPGALMGLLSGCFDAQREFTDSYNDARKDDKDNLFGDPERLHATTEREMFLRRQQEIDRQSPELRWRTSDTTRLGLQEFMDTMLVRDDVRIDGITLGGTTITEGLADYDLLQPLRRTDAATGQLSFEPLAVGFVSYALTGERHGRDPHVMPLIWRYEGTDGGSHYVRITATIEPDTLNRDFSENSMSDDVEQRPEVVTMLVAHDLESPEKKLQEFNFMWNDAKDKIRDGQQSELSDEQQLIYDITEPNLAYCLYWGRSCMSHKRYYEALRYFRNAYGSLRLDMLNLSDSQRKLFYDLCYYIGFCYCDLHLYELAYYYLDSVANIGRIDYTEEYINALANSGDWRVFRTINHVRRDIDEQWGDDEDLPESMRSFLDFLDRREAYSFVNLGKLDEAERAFRKMLDNPDNHDYAVDELAYIQKLRKQQETCDGKQDDTPADKPAGEKADEPAEGDGNNKK